MSNLLKAELYKIRRHKSIYLMGAIMMLLSFPFSYWYRSHTMQETLAFTFEVQLLFPLIMVIGVMGAILITSEYVTGGFKRLVCVGHTRKNIVLAKTIVFALLTLVISLIMPFLAAITISILEGFSYAQVNWMFTLRVVLLVIVVNSGIAALAVLISLLFKNVIAALGLFYGIYNVYFILQGVSSQNKILDQLFQLTIFGQIRVATADTITSIELLKLLGVSFVTIMGSYAISIWLFRRTEIK